MTSLRAKLARPQIIQGMTLGTLLRVLAKNGFIVDTQYLGRLAYLMALGVFNSLYGACETFFNADAIREVRIEQPPLFVIGHWRSGTTHLHNLLSLDEHFTYPTAFQALFPHHFVFSQAGGILFNLLAPSKRPMDEVAFGSHVPHEDEFAVAAASTVSPYMRVLFPLTGDDCSTQLDPGRIPPRLLEEWKESLILFMKKLTFSEPGRIVLKSPPHLGRVGTLLDMFPAAQFVHIVRNPYDVYESTKKLWQDSFAYVHLQKPDPELVDELILSWYVELFSLFERDRRLVPANALYEVKFEDLEARPVETLRAVYETLGLQEFEVFEKRACSYLETIRNYRKNVHQLTEADRKKVGRRWRTTFERYGYPL